jgi:release factor glutamine methyltransferase
VLKTDPRALIPRPETELLAEEAIRRLAGRPAEGGLLVADVCCGCGALGLSVAAELPQARVILTDVSAEALDLARENVPLVPGVGARVEFRQGLDLAPLADVAGTLDAIVCNPPYVATGELGALQPEICYEPRLALDGGEDGLDFYRRIAGQWRRFVRPDGFLAVEVGAGQAEEVRRLLVGADTPSPRPSPGGRGSPPPLPPGEGRGEGATEAVDVHTRRDYGGIERVIVAVRAQGGVR